MSDQDVIVALAIFGVLISVMLLALAMSAVNEEDQECSDKNTSNAESFNKLERDEERSSEKYQSACQSETIINNSIQDSGEEGVSILVWLYQHFRSSLHNFGPTRRMMIKRWAFQISRKALSVANAKAYTDPDGLTLSEHMEILGDYLAVISRDQCEFDAERIAIVNGLRAAMKRENLPVRIREIIIAGLTPRIMSGIPANVETETTFS